MQKLVTILLAAFAMFGATAAHAALVVVNYELETTDGIVIGTGQFSYDDGSVPTNYTEFTSLSLVVGDTSFDAGVTLGLIQADPTSKTATKAMKDFDKYLSSLAKTYGDALFIRDASTGALLGDLSRKGQLTFQNLPTVAASVPEPGTWLFSMLGFAAAGFALRRRRPEIRVRTYNGKPLPEQA